MEQIPYEEIKNINGTEPIEAVRILDKAGRVSPEKDRSVYAVRYDSKLNGHQVILYRITKKLNEDKESVLSFCLSLEAANALADVTNELLNRLPPAGGE